MPGYAPAVSTIVAKLVAVPATLPFEQIATRKQGGLSLGKLFRGDVLRYTLGREISFSIAFWTINERLYRPLREYTSVVNATTAAALFSGVAGGIASYPMDAVRTWQTNHPDKFSNNSVLHVIINIVKEKGYKYLIASILSSNLGLPLRIFSASLGNTLFFYLYSLSINFLERQSSSAVNDTL